MERKIAKRAAKVTEAQKEAMVSYMESHRQFAAGKFVGKDGRIQYDQQWGILTQILNDVDPRVAKDSKKWQIVWRDIRFKSANKASAIRRARLQTGNVPINEPPLTPFDLRVNDILGPVYSEGNGAEESLPEREDEQINMESAEVQVEKNIYDEVPKRDINVFIPLLEASIGHEVPIVCPESPDINLALPRNGSVKRVSTDEPETEDNQFPRTPAGKTYDWKAGSAGNWRKRRQTVGTQLTKARVEMTQIQSAQASALQGIAEAMKISAEAARLNALNNCRLTEQFEKIIGILDGIQNNSCKNCKNNK